MMSRLLSILLFLAYLHQSINQSTAQTYVPRSVLRTDCGTGTYHQFGHNEVSRLALTTGSSPASYFTHRKFNGTSGTIINQLSLGINANTISTVAFLRLGLFLVGSTTFTLVGQTDEISLYTTPADIIYADLLTPVTLQSAVYAVVLWSSLALQTGSDVAPVEYNTPYQCYTCTTSAPFWGSYSFSYSYGERALAAHGCKSTALDPYTAPNTEIYGVCAFVQTSTPAPRDPNYLYNWEKAAVTTTNTFKAVLAVSTINVGGSGATAWNYVNAANGGIDATSTSPWYYPDPYYITSVGRTLVLGPGPVTTYNQRFYRDGTTKVDENGLSFVAIDGTQLIVRYVNNSYQFLEVEGNIQRPIVGSSSGIEIRRLTSVSEVSSMTCAAPFRTTSAAPITCPAGSTPIQIGFLQEEAMKKWYNSQYDYLYGNQIYMSEVTAWAANTELRQLNMLINPQSGQTVARIRFAVYVRAATGSSTYRMVAQTNEITVANNQQPHMVRANLLSPLTLTRGLNYSLAMISDVGLTVPLGYWTYTADSIQIDTYDFVVGNGWPAQLSSTPSGYYSPPLGASGCVLTTQATQYSFCAAFVYAGYTKVYEGIMDTVNQDQTDDYGTYRPIIGGRGLTHTYWVGDDIPESYNFSVNNFNLFTNNRLYTSKLDAGAVDDFGFAVLTEDEYDSYAAQIRSFVDRNSASRELVEYTQYFYTTYVQENKNVVSTFSYRVYTGGAIPRCALPERPQNLVSPASAPRFTCPNNGNFIADTFGDADVGKFALNADGTTVNGDRVYTQAFTAENNAIVRQLAVGILNNANQVPTILVRMGLYSAANNSLIVQTGQLSLFQAVDQVIVMNLPFAVSIIAGQTYWIALLSNNPIEVATAATQDSPSMSHSFGPTGLPATFVAARNQPGISIAAFACVEGTHSFCGYNQIYNQQTRVTSTYLYQGLLQTGAISQTNAAGTFLPIYAAGGRVTLIQRTFDYPSTTRQIRAYQQTLGTAANLYTSGNGGQQIDTTGLSLTDTDNTVHVIKSANGATQVVVGGMDMTRVRQLFSGFSVTSLNDPNGIPACGLEAVPRDSNTLFPPPECGAGNELVSYGNSDPFGVRYATEGSSTTGPNRISMRPFVTAPDRLTMLTQIRFGVLTNPSTYSRMRFALYDANNTLMASTSEIELINGPTGQYGGLLNPPQTLQPNTAYQLAIWIENSLYAGYDNTVTQSIELSYVGNTWPGYFSTVDGGKNGDNMRAIGALGCLTTRVAPPQSSSSTASPRPSSTALPNPTSSAPAQTSTIISPSSSSSSSTGEAAAPASSTSNSAGLSNGAVAGLVIGCVIGANLLLLALFYLFCLSSGAAAGSTFKNLQEVENSRVEPSQIEMGEATSTEE